MSKEDWRAAIADIEAQSDDGDLVLLNSPGLVVIYPHYQRRMSLDVRPVTLKDKDDPGALYAQDLDYTSARHSRVWLVLSHSHEVDPLKQWLSRFYVPVESRELYRH